MYSGTVLITSGPTREHLDPVRYLSNASTGRMGAALAEAAARAGGHVVFVTGPVAEERLPRHELVEIVQVTGAAEMLEAARAPFSQADIAVFAAAVADYRPAHRSEQKEPKTDNASVLELEPTPDIAGTLCQKKEQHQVAIGFALQTHDGLQKAREKLIRKKLDGIVLNAMDALGGSSGTYRFLRTGKEAFEDWGHLTKELCAQRIFQEAAALRQG